MAAIKDESTLFALFAYHISEEKDSSFLLKQYANNDLPEIKNYIAKDLIEELEGILKAHKDNIYCDESIIGISVFSTNEAEKIDGELLSTSFCTKLRCASFQCLIFSTIFD